MDWRKNIVRILMLATLVVAASAPAKAARPGVFRGRKPPRIPQVVTRRPVQSNWNSGSLRRGHGYGSVNTGNAEHMRPTGNINRGQIHPRPGYDSYPYRSKPGSSNMGTIGSFTREADYGKSVRNAASNAIEKPVTAPPFSKNNYQKSSDTFDYDKFFEALESWGKIEEMPEPMKEVGPSYPNLDRDESTTMKNTNVNAGDTEYWQEIPVFDLSKSRMKTREEMLTSPWSTSSVKMRRKLEEEIGLHSARRMEMIRKQNEARELYRAGRINKLPPFLRPT